MPSTSPRPASPPLRTIGSVQVVPFLHAQGCRTYLVADPRSGQALAVDAHLDLVGDVAKRVEAEGWTLPYVLDTHTHADHPSGARALAARFSSTRIAHRAGGHAGVSRHPEDGETLHLGDVPVLVRHAPGHTPDHLVLLADGLLFSGDSLFIGSVARTDFLGGDARALFDTLRRVLFGLPDSTVVYPGHDYGGRVETTLGKERRENPWLSILDREEFARRLTENPPPRPANMDDLLRWNREGNDFAARMPAAEAVARVRAGGATSVIDVRSGIEVEAEHVPGSRHIPLDEMSHRVDEVRATPAPRLLLCRTGRRAEVARATLVDSGIGGLCVVEGGIEAYRDSGGETVRNAARMSLERQVRIVAGTLVLVGTGLGVFVHPVFLGLAAFIGAGQVFAGLTDWCGMGLLLARMPWNRARPKAIGSGEVGGCAAPASPCAAAPSPATGQNGGASQASSSRPA